MGAWILCLLIASGKPSLVTLHAPRAQVHATTAQLRVQLRADNALPAPVARLLIGVTVGNGTPDPNVIFRDQLPPGAWRHDGAHAVAAVVPLALPPQGSADVALALPGYDPAWGDTAATHMLGYEAPRAEWAVIERMLDNAFPADEWAAVQRFALLTEPPIAPQASPALRDALLSATLPLPPAPSRSETRRWVLAILALATLRDEVVASHLEHLLAEAPLETLDDSVRLLVVTRASVGPYQAPLAHALPAQVRRARDLVQWALTAPVPPAAPEPTPAPAPPPEPKSPPWLWLVASVVVGLVVGLALMIGGRRAP